MPLKLVEVKRCQYVSPYNFDTCYEVRLWGISVVYPPAHTLPRRPSVPQETLVTGSFDLQDVLFYGGCGFTIMRCMSFALENCDRKEGSYSFLDLLKYNFYLPFFFFGPIMTFDQFHAQVCPLSGRVGARISEMGFYTLMC